MATNRFKTYWSSGSGVVSKPAPARPIGLQSGLGAVNVDAAAFGLVLNALPGNFQPTPTPTPTEVPPTTGFSAEAPAPDAQFPPAMPQTFAAADSEDPDTQLDAMIDQAAKQYINKIQPDTGASGGAPGEARASKFDQGCPSPTFQFAGLAAQNALALVHPAAPHPNEVVPGLPPVMEPKTMLSQFAQKYTRRPITQTDVVYTCVSHGRWSYQATVTVNCVNGEMVAGLVCHDRRDAEKSAALHACQHFGVDEATSMLMAETIRASVDRKLKAQLGGAPQQKHIPGPSTATLFPNASQWKSPLAQPEVPALAFGQAIVQGDDQLAMAVASMPPIQHGPPNMDDLPLEIRSQGYKQAIQTVMGKVTKAVLQKNAILYESWMEKGGYVATVRIPVLPDPYATQSWIGENCQKRKDAETSAAGACLGALLEDQRIKQALKAPKSGSLWKGSQAWQVKQLTVNHEKTWLGVSVDGGPSLGSIEISPGTSFASVRVLIKSRMIRGLPDNYLFYAHGATVNKEDEGKYLGIDFMPTVVVTSEDLKSNRKKGRSLAVEDRPRSRDRRRGRSPLALEDGSGYGYGHGGGRAIDSSASTRARSRSRSRRRR